MHSSDGLNNPVIAGKISRTETLLDRLIVLPAAPQLPRTLGLVHVSTAMHHAEVDVNVWKRLKSHADLYQVEISAAVCVVLADVLALWARDRHFTVAVAVPTASDELNRFALLEFGSDDAPFIERLKTFTSSFVDWKETFGLRTIEELRAGAPNNRTFLSDLCSCVFVSSGASSRKSSVSKETDAASEEIYPAGSAHPLIRNMMFERGDQLLIQLETLSDAFPAGVAEGMLESFVDALVWLGDDQEGWHSRTTARLPYSQRERRQSFNATDGVQTDELLHTLFDRQAGIRPEWIALHSSRRSLTYGALATIATQIGCALRAENVKPNTIVAIVMEKGWEQVAAALGILVAGGAYLPIDPAMPRERMAYILSHAEVKNVLTQQHLDASLVWPSGVRTWCVDRADHWPPAASGYVRPVQQVTDLAYVIYTSGSTGQPKGVAIDHRGAVNTLLDLNDRFKINEHDRVLALSSLSFDLSVYDVFGTLAAGATIVMPDFERQREPAHWLELLQNRNVTIWNSVPALLQMLCEFSEGTQFDANLRLIWLSGDWIPVKLPDEIRVLTPNAEVVSLGGATEASIWSIIFPIDSVDPRWRSIPYGRPMRNQRFYVLNALFEECPDWVPGFLFIGGIGLAHGYWKDQEKTASAFIYHPKTGERLYRTGDLGRFLPNGNIEFLGRIDNQVKIQGYRIEIGEVEAALHRHEAVRFAVVIAQGETAADRRLAAYLVLQDGSRRVGTAELRMFLGTIIPEYMIPSVFLCVEQMPTTANGKIDRQALANFAATPLASQPYEHQVGQLPMSSLEATVARIWREVLDVKDIGTSENFFEIGGQSLQLVRVYRRLREQLMPNLQIGDLFDLPTIAMISAFIESAAKET
ncbi:amino acid adenylation domain-containing protein [Rhizobium rhizogenes]|uniref:amino acid adenylation domain-containing protein n=1 Tax=Rhizobium rhizogenes TaxID=359 RepID=UPI001295A153|nr:amino acid adenylation domain-containing protein [Rhizobium rhizogenes]MQB34207.1 amino acid adenylation domain-containing protein [Rhizobium rhizogenes]